jgi:hypothetical protein
VLLWVALFIVITNILIVTVVTFPMCCLGYQGYLCFEVAMVTFPNVLPRLPVLQFYSVHPVIHMTPDTSNSVYISKLIEKIQLQNT